MTYFCTECGYKLSPDAAFCGNCGKKITETLSKTVSMSPFLSESTEFNHFQKVFAWVLKTLVDTLVELTTLIAPYFNSYIVMRENVLQSVGSAHDKDDGTVENLLFRLPIVLGSQFNLDALVEVKEEAILSNHDLVNLKNVTVSTFESYISTEKALSVIRESTVPINNGRIIFAQLRKREDITNFDALSKYEELATRFKEKINDAGFTDLMQEDTEYWINQREKRSYAFLSIQDELEFYSWPWMRGRNITTDLERAYVPYFTYTSSLDNSYLKCKQLFLQCQNETGFLRNPSNDLKKEAVDSLHEFNASYMTLASTNWYSDSKLKLIKKINDIRKTLIEEMNNFNEGKRKQRTRIILKQLFNIISLMNEIEPVNNIWGPLTFED